MSANIHGKMVYSFQKPMWHNITDPSNVPMSAEGILDDRFDGGFGIETRPITVQLNDAQVETGDFAIVRGVSPDDKVERVFGYCSDRYLPLQPREVARSFDLNVLEPAETMGFLGHGETMFISWKMPSFEVVSGDPLDMYGIVNTGFDTLKGTKLFTSIYRPVCSNTLSMAQNWANSNSDGVGKGNIWKGKAVNKNLLRDLGFWLKHVQVNAIREANLLESFMSALAKTPVKSDDEVISILETSFPDKENVSKYYPKELSEAKNETTLSYNEAQGKIRNGIFDLFSGAGTAITPDYYGVLNATTEYFCHVMPSKRPIASSVMFGSRQKMISDVVETLQNRM